MCYISHVTSTQCRFPSSKPLMPEQTQISPLTKGLIFLFGFFLQFDVLVGGGGEGAAATGGYGYRISDVFCVIAIILLAIYALPPRRLFALAIFGAGIAAMAGIRVLEPTFSDDSRTIILALHYLAYSFAGLYLAILLFNEAGRDAYCWGLILGLLATLPIFVLQDSGNASALVNLGLLPGYYQVFRLDFGDTLRYAGLWGHPNEAAHVAALAAPAAAYLFLVQRRVFPLVLVAGALLVTFYYTQSRGGFLAGGGILAVSLLFRREGRIDIVRALLAGVAVVIGVVLISQIGFVSSRFEDAGTADNFSTRLDSVLFGLQMVITHPFGLSMLEFYSAMSSGTGGIVSPHNGFIFFAVVFGWLPFVLLMAAIIKNLHVRSNQDILFALISFGIVLSSLFEQLPGSYPFAFVICMIVGWAFLNTRLGGALKAAGVHPGASPNWLIRRSFLRAGQARSVRN
jgi:O-Antigen ligase